VESVRAFVGLYRFLCLFVRSMGGLIRHIDAVDQDRPRYRMIEPERLGYKEVHKYRNGASDDENLDRDYDGRTAE